MSEQKMYAALKVLKAGLNETSQPTPWFELTQEKINNFADVTHDHQWIHVDEKRAKSGPFGAPIAHGHLTLSIMCAGFFLFLGAYQLSNMWANMGIRNIDF